MRIRRGRPADLKELMNLERACFEQARWDSEKTCRTSLASPHQEVWVAEAEGRIAGALFLRFHPRTCRVHSIAVHPRHQGVGLGKQLLELAKRRARARGAARMSLEADSRNRDLIAWYQHHGYRIVRHLKDYYARRWHAYRFELALNPGWSRRAAD